MPPSPSGQIIECCSEARDRLRNRFVQRFLLGHIGLHRLFSDNYQGVLVSSAVNLPTVDVHVVNTELKGKARGLCSVGKKVRGFT